MAFDKDAFLTSLDSMTVMELNDLVKAIEEKFGVSAAAMATSEPLFAVPPLGRVRVGILGAGRLAHEAFMGAARRDRPGRAVLAERRARQSRLKRDNALEIDEIPNPSANFRQRFDGEHGMEERAAGAAGAAGAAADAIAASRALCSGRNGLLFMEYRCNHFINYCKYSGYLFR